MMLPRHVQTVRYMLERLIPVAQLRGINTHFCVWYSTLSACNELPRNLKMSERKPLVTSFNELKRQARRKRKERQNVHEILLQPPENGLLVKQLIPIAHQVYAARSELLSSVSRLVKHIAIYTCSLCGDVHVGHPPHNIRTCNVRGSPSSKEHSWVKGAIAVRGMKAWEKMCTGASKLMDTYAFQTCGYCPEVQVGPKGHRVRNCQAFKHQMRDGQHAWQEATINDLVPPVYVYHIGDQQSGKPLVHELKRYYGMLPAVVELFAQAGATVEKNYAHSMREDVVVPEMDEEKLVV